MKKVKILGLVSCLMLFVIASCDDSGKFSLTIDQMEETRVQGTTMGALYSIQVVGNFYGGEQTLTELADTTFNKIWKEISTFDSNAELALFNDYKSTEPFEISTGLARIVSEAIYKCKMLDGALDITVGPIVNLWGFGPEHPMNIVPPEKTIEATLANIGLDKIEFKIQNNKNYLIKKNPNVKLDLANVGEGLCVDSIAFELLKRGYKNFMVTVDSVSKSFGVNSDGGKWKIGINDPNSVTPVLFSSICSFDKAVATSGAYSNFFRDKVTGNSYSHVIDPKTGHPITHSTLSVTVVSETAFDADALATGLLVMGADKALEWAEKNNYAIATIEYKNGKSFMRNTTAFEPHLICGARNEDEF